MRNSVKMLAALTLGLSLTVSAASIAAAQSYPEHPITFVVGFSAGGFADSMGRVIAENLGRELGHPVIVENIGGAGGDIAAARVASSAADGYTVLVTTASYALSEALGSPREYTIADLTPVAIPVSSPEALAAHPSVPANNLAEFIAWAKTQDVVTFGHAGAGTGSQVSASYFLNQIAGLDNIIEVTYSGGGPANQAAISGEVQIVGSSNSVYPFIREGLLTGLGIASEEAIQALPGVATYAEQGYSDFVVSSWVGLLVPTGTDPAIIETLNAAVNKVMSSETAQSRFADAGASVAVRDVTEVNAFFERDLTLWREMANAAAQ